MVLRLLPSLRLGRRRLHDGDGATRGPGKPVTIPVTIRVKEETELELQNIDLTISEDGEPQTIISIQRRRHQFADYACGVDSRGSCSSVGNEIKSLAEFITKLAERLARDDRVFANGQFAGQAEIHKRS